MSLRPILKRSATTTSSSSSHVVHFPPSSSLTTHTYSAYSSTAYDRSPIIVAPNTCALPERGCPGRTYNLDDSGHHLHPRAIAMAARDAHLLYPPPLVPDISSSESDESDGFSAVSYTPSNSHHILGLAIPTKDRYDPYNSYDPSPYHPSPLTPSAALAFLPHPPSPPSKSPYPYPYHDDDDPTPDVSQTSKHRRRRERKHDSSRTPDRIPYAPECYSPPTKYTLHKAPPSAKPSHSSPFRTEDDGCLGGF